MKLIQIQTPNEKNEVWLQCQIIKLEVNQFKNSGSIHVKGIAKTQNVNTIIVINDFKSLIDGEIVTSLHGYFKLLLRIENTETIEWFKEAFKF